MDLKTTTRPKRSTAEFEALRRIVKAPSSGRPLEVANIGPGLAVRYFGRLTATSIPGWQVFRRLESGLRRIPMPDFAYENYETSELIAALGDIPFNLTVIDINPRVARVVTGNTRRHSVQAVLADLGEERSVRLAPYRGKFDVIVAIAVIGRVKQKAQENARDNVRSLLRPGGILVGGSDVAEGAFARVAEGENLFLKPLSSGQRTT
jgi:hypothetical protein